MKERPILFSTSMVQAILAGRKTMTRRTRGLEEINKHPDWHAEVHQDGGGNWVFWYPGKQPGLAEFTKRVYPNGEGIPCPYGRTGDRLWVRETFCSFEDGDIFYAADWPKGTVPVHADDDSTLWRWRSPIYMPRWASRISLEIVNVRAERVQEISRADCLAEGISQRTFAAGILSDTPPDPRWKFIETWGQLNARRGYDWETNPWVWVIEFGKLD